MSIRDLFNKKAPQILVSKSLDDLGSEVESDEYVYDFIEQKERFVPHIDFSEPEKFVRFGLAEKYYADSIKRIYNTYPFDGSLKEKVAWHNSSSNLDNWMFDNEYPRTTGYAKFSPEGWGTYVTASGNNFAAPASASMEYIQFKGGPNAGPAGTRVGANIYNTTGYRESNLRFGGDNGNTIEFWFKGGQPVAGTSSVKEVIFDLWNGEEVTHSVSSQYGRFMVYLDAAATAPSSSLYVTYVSGNVSTCTAQELGTGSTVQTASVFNDVWKHYAVSAVNVGSDLHLKLHVNGALNNVRTVSNGAINEVTGALIANLASLRTKTTPTESPAADNGWGKLTGSLDEFRFWKRARNSKQIGRYWFTQVGGGTNTDASNTNLGVYYKFNEGLTTTASVDSIVLDYSGRITHGAWTGYSGSAYRSTGSAIEEYDSTKTEFKDPIIYSTHADVVTLINQKQQTGSYFDVNNNSNIFNSLPAFITDEDEEYSDGHLTKLTQIIASYFDDLYLQIEALPDLKNATYISGGVKPYYFTNRMLEANGFIAPEIFLDADELAQFGSRDENEEYTDKLYNVKNLIYKNIHNNLSYIYKSKGTEKSFRNLIRCFGIDEEVLKINLYADNVTHEIRNNFRGTSVKKKYVDFNGADRFSSTVYQYATESYPHSVGYILGSRTDLNTLGEPAWGIDIWGDDVWMGTSGSGINTFALYGGHAPFTAQAEVILPKKFSNDTSYYFSTPFVTCSLFGCHTPTLVTSSVISGGVWGPTGSSFPATWMGTASYTADTTYAFDDYTNFQVYAVRDKIDSGNVYFMLTGSDVSPVSTLTSSLFEDQYENVKWNLAVRVKQSEYPLVNRVTGTSYVLGDEVNTFVTEFYGVSMVGDTILNEFSVTGSALSYTTASAFISSPKRMYAGAYRQNFTGAVNHRSDAKISSVRVWLDYLTDEEIKAHARDADNFGCLRPYRKMHPMNTELDDIYFPRTKALILNWDFMNVTASDASTVFYVEDASSGSIPLRNRYGWVSKMSDVQHLGKGNFFPVSSTTVVDPEYIYSAKQRAPGVIDSDDMIEILERDDETFTRETRPVKHFFAVEKSMYQTISDEILKYFATIKDFNNLIGEPVNRYRPEYKSLQKLRQLIFERFRNIPDIEKYIEYYKWIDSSLSKMIEQLIPASANMSEDVRNVIESHILERNKYWTKYPTLEMKHSEPEDAMRGINEMLYRWDIGHAPIDGDENKSCLWQNQKKERTTPTALATDRNRILTASLSAFDRKLDTPIRLKVEKEELYKGGANPDGEKKSWSYLLDFLNTRFNQEGYLKTKRNQIIDTVCSDATSSDKKKRHMGWDKVPLAQNEYEEGKGKLHTPFSLYTSSTETKKWQYVNMHLDSYGPDNEVPAQTPFTEKWVGGLQFRHIRLNPTATGSNEFYRDDENVRPEGFRIFQSSSEEDYVVGPEKVNGLTASIHVPRATRYRDGMVKRPVNIANIRTWLTKSLDHITASGKEVLGDVGNYYNVHEIVQTSDRSINNAYLVRNEGVINGLSASLLLSNSISQDYTKNIRGKHKHVFVERFSAPGGKECMGDADGGLGLDAESGQFSPYNSINYRNMVVRGIGPIGSYHRSYTDGLNYLHRNRCGQFGINYTLTASSYDYALSASFHKVHRNGVTRLVYSSSNNGSTETVVTGTSYDNWFIQHPIPRYGGVDFEGNNVADDMRFSWMSASLLQAPYPIIPDKIYCASRTTTDFYKNVGAGWEDVGFPADLNSPALLSVDGSSINNIWIAGGSGIDGAWMARSTDGATWTTDHTQPASGSNAASKIYTIYAYSDTEVYAVWGWLAGNQYAIYKWNGASWSSLNNGSMYVGATQYLGAAHTRGMVKNGNTIIITGRYGIWYSDDNGANWQLDNSMDVGSVDFTYGSSVGYDQSNDRFVLMGIDGFNGMAYRTTRWWYGTPENWTLLVEHDDGVGGFQMGEMTSNGQPGMTVDPEGKIFACYDNGGNNQAYFIRGIETGTLNITIFYQGDGFNGNYSTCPEKVYSIFNNSGNEEIKKWDGSSLTTGSVPDAVGFSPTNVYVVLGDCRG